MIDFLLIAAGFALAGIIIITIGIWWSWRKDLKRLKDEGFYD